MVNVEDLEGKEIGNSRYSVSLDPSLLTLGARIYFVFQVQEWGIAYRVQLLGSSTHICPFNCNSQMAFGECDTKTGLC